LFLVFTDSNASHLTAATVACCSPMTSPAALHS
jgi:hypothetical protein